MDNAFIKMIERYQGVPGVKYEVQYVDTPNSWTYPALLTKNRGQRLIDDASVLKVRITTHRIQFEIENK